ncbi:DUF3800 domain-containing protein [Clostridium perfringens]|uniref:DUF3800 domain-containing protein n=1 Tax=Clostridium perfringens TaxID=1502 RepID=UPI002FCCE0EB
MKLKIFFDESGKNNTPPMTMGAIAIPENVYLSEKINSINDKLKKENLKYHFTQFNGDRNMEKRILELFQEMSPFLHTIRGNILQYSNRNVDGEIFDLIRYSKFPERVFYGLLRCKGNLMKIEADIFMEEATEYIEFPDKFKSQLNTQAIYRGEYFKIQNCCLVPKYTEIGVEFTDIILGVIRIILDFEKVITKTSKTYKAKVNLVNKILDIPNVYKFFSNLKYFEWDNKQSLKEIKFKDYLDTYISINY